MDPETNAELPDLHEIAQIGMAKFRATFADVMAEIERTQTPIVVRKHGRPLVALVPPGWLKQLVPVAGESLAGVPECEEEPGE